MYEAKTRRSERVHATAVAVESGALVDITGSERPKRVAEVAADLPAPVARVLESRVTRWGARLHVWVFSSQPSAFSISLRWV